MHSPMRVTASPPHLPMTITTNNSPESSTSEMSSCLVTREFPKDYLLDLENDRVNVSHQNNYPNRATDKKKLYELYNFTWVPCSQNKSHSVYYFIQR